MIDRRKNWHGYHVFAVDGSKLQPLCVRIDVSEK